MHRVFRPLAAAFTLAATCLAVPLAHAQTPAPYPAKPVRIVVGYSAGGPTDLVARLVATQLQAATGQPFLVENKPGAGSNLATELVAGAAPDGYTLLLAAAPITMNAFLYKGLKWDVQKSLDPVSMVMSAPSILAVNPQVPARSVQELITLAKQQPGKLSFGSTGIGGSQHMAGEVFKQRAGVDIVHVPYKGAAPALQDLIAGHVTMAFMTSLSAVPHIKAGKIRALGVASRERMPQLPDLPTVGESGLPGFEADSWNGLFAPHGTPPEVINRLHAEIARIAASADFKDKLQAQGAVVVGNSPAEFRSFIRNEVEGWAKVFQTVQVKAE
ncbi:MAG: tripartite tricarboxylate transporter substrate binding protein [Rubrivivax sp.]|nr:tripartite tricarboxylate transporter substrate binding protein [Rubrivivax sp.]